MGTLLRSLLKVTPDNRPRCRIVTWEASQPLWPGSHLWDESLVPGYGSVLLAADRKKTCFRLFKVPGYGIAQRSPVMGQLLHAARGKLRKWLLFEIPHKQAPVGNQIESEHLLVSLR